MSRFNRLALALILGLGLAIAALTAASARLGPTVDSLNTDHELDGASVTTLIALTFTEPMNHASVQHRFHVAPAVRGQFSWSGNQLLFTPARPLRYSTRYTVTVDRSAVSAQGKELYRPFSETFATQSQHLLYLGTQGREDYRLVMAGVTGARQIIGPDDGLVTDYALSFDRSIIALVKKPSPNARPSEIWILNPSTGTDVRIFAHSDWTITEPRFSPDNRYIAFLATNVLLCQYYRCTRDKTGPLIYILNRSTGKVFRFQPEGNAPLTYFVDFSPAGQVAYTDLGSALTLASPKGSGVFHVPDQGNSPSYVGFDTRGDKAAFVGQTPSSSGGDVLVYEHSKYIDVSRGVYDSSTPAFSTSDTRLAYAGYRGELGIEPVYGINVYDFTHSTTSRLTIDKNWSDWAPQWSLDDRYIAFVRSRPREAMYMGSGVVWVVESNGAGARPIGGVGKQIRWFS